MGFGASIPKAQKDIVTIHRTIETPIFKDVDTPRAVFYDVPTPRAKFVDEIIKRPIPQDEPFRVPRAVFEDIPTPRAVFVNETVTVKDVVVEEVKKIIEVPDFQIVKTEALTQAMQSVLLDCLKEAMRGAIAETVKTTPIEKKYNIDVPVIKEREVITDKPKYREIIIDIIKPHYICQKCGLEV